MQSRRTSKRTNSSCQCVANPFSNNIRNQPLSTKIPHSITRHISHNDTVSCQQIENLPTFQPGANLNEELQRIQRATQFQLNWETQILQPSVYQMGREMKKDQVQSGRMMEMRGVGMDEEGSTNLWKDPVFLQKLNDFIMSRPSTRKQLLETQLMLQN